MSSPDLFSVNDRCFVGKMRVMGIYQTGKRRFIRDNTEKTDELVLKREYDNKYDEFAVAVYALVKLFGKEDDGSKEDASHEV